MFSEAEYGMFFNGTCIADSPFNLDYTHMTTGNKYVMKTEDFEKFEELENFVLKQKRRRKTFMTIAFPDVADLGEIVQNRELARSFFASGAPPPVPEYITDRPNPEIKPNLSGKKEPYKLFNEDMPEGISAQNFFLATEFTKLAKNYTRETKNDPFTPPNRTLRLTKLDGNGYNQHFISQEFWLFALREFKAHERARVLQGEEKSNCFKEGASARWSKCDKKSLLVNAVVPPPKGDFFMPAMGSK